MRVKGLLKYTWPCNCHCWVGTMAVSDPGSDTDRCDKSTFISSYHILIIREAKKWAHRDRSLWREDNLDVFIFSLLVWMCCLISLHLKSILWYRRDNICLISARKPSQKQQSSGHCALAIRSRLFAEGKAQSSPRAEKRRALGWKDEWGERPLVELCSVSNLPGNRLSFAAL